MLEERVVLEGGRQVTLRFSSPSDYSLRFLRNAQPLVEYANRGNGHRRKARGREEAYEFRSVEQLRYDFERDAADAQRQG
jgi:hypothetical protein